MNHVTLIGRIVRNLELRTTNNEKSYVFFTIAVNDTMRKDHTDFINCVAWNKTAENMVKYVGKGSLISIVGKLSVRKDNRDQFITEVVANNVTFLDNNKKKDSPINSVSDDFSNQPAKPKKTVNIDEAFNRLDEYDTEISFINNKTVNNTDNDDDEDIIWDN